MASKESLVSQPSTSGSKSDPNRGQPLPTSDDEGISIVYPSGKLGAITRKKNEIEKYQNEGGKDVHHIKVLKSSFETKISKFENECKQELEKNVSQDDKKSFEKWMRKHKKSYDIHIAKLNIWLLENEKDSDELIAVLLELNLLKQMNQLLKFWMQS